MQNVESPVLLLAEDDEDTAYLFRRCFTKACPGWKFVWAQNGIIAVKHIMEIGMPQAVVTDLNMPNMSGFELISWIRTKDDRPRVPIIVMSSLCEPDVRQKCRQLGADDFIPKLSAPEKLHGMLHRLASTLAGDRVLSDFSLT